MTFKEKILKLLHKIYRNDNFTINLTNGASKLLNNADTVISRLSSLFHFNRLDTSGCEWWEKLLTITDINQNLEDRQAKIRAKWISNVHNDIELIQKVCESWKRGEAEADFINGKIKLEFIGSYGVPDAIDSLIKSINEVKPAHLALMIFYKYLLIEDIHEVKTLEEMENLTIDMFSFGLEAA